MAEQLPLPLAYREALDQDSFLVSDSNLAAVRWMDAWPDWPAPALLVYGPQGSGKSHLARVFMRHTGAILAAPEDWTAWAASMHRPAVLEDLHNAMEDREEALFHLLNRLRETGQTALLTSTIVPARMSITLADLASRLRGLPAVGLGPPDDDLLAGVLAKQFADRGIRVSGTVLDYLVRHMERSHAAARSVVEALDRAALDRRQAITVPLAKRVLEKG